jgi:hypothetical protein
MRSIPYPESALNPTMVGVPPEKGGEPVIISPPRSTSSAGERVGAVVGPEPSQKRRNVSAVQQKKKKIRRRQSDIEPGSTIESTGYDGPTEGAIARNPNAGGDEDTVDSPHTQPMPEAVVEDTTSSTTEHIAKGKAREVFELLRKAGLKARSYSDDAFDAKKAKSRPARRSNEKAALRFEQAIISLTGGDLNLALAHFRAMLDQMPESTRVRAFVDAIESVRDEGGEHKTSILDDFEGALEDAIAYGRCPKCFSMMAADEGECFACGFALPRKLATSQKRE